MPDGPHHGLLRYLNGDSDPMTLRPQTQRSGFKLSGPARWWTRGIGRVVADQRDGMSVTGISTATPTPLMHTVELKRRHRRHRHRPALHANWTWAPSALDHARVKPLSELWFEALAGICAPTSDAAGGLTPFRRGASRLRQQQIDELELRNRSADILPGNPLQQGALSRPHRAGQRRHVCGQLDLTVTGALDPHRLRGCGAHRSRPASEPGRPSATSSTSPCRYPGRPRK